MLLLLKMINILLYCILFFSGEHSNDSIENSWKQLTLLKIFIWNRNKINFWLTEVSEMSYLINYIITIKVKKEKQYNTG